MTPGAPSTTDAPPRPAPVQRAHGPLTPVEVATAGVLSGLAVVLGLFASLMPFFNNVFLVLAAVPVAMVSVRMRARAWVTAAAATLLMALMLGGVSTAITVGQSVLPGVVVGILRRRGVGLAGATTVGVVIGAGLGALADLALWLLADLRTLFLESARVSVTGYLRLLGRWEVLTPATDALTRLVEAFLSWWWVWVPASVLLSATVIVVVAYWILGAVLARLRLGSDWDPLLAGPAAAATHTPSTPSAPATPAPLPTTLTDVRYRYPGSDTDALAGVDLAVRPGEFVVVVGPNGSGKSTLALVLAGAEPTSGTVTRPGAVGLGLPGGVALLAQRTELQMLGETVAEDVLWGMPDDQRDEVDVAALLDLVGLPGLAGATTRLLSGGQLQRLALAGVLARRPALLVSDESTAMVDPSGRAELIAVLASLPARGTTVVHITHDASEARGADRVVRMLDGRVTFGGPPPRDPGAESPTTAPTAGPALVTPSRIDEDGAAPRTGVPAPTGAPGGAWRPVEHLWADRVSHAYDVGTPWEKLVLRDVSLILDPGEAVLVTGENGSGKTTLSRVLTGLLRPTWGRCTLGGRPVADRVGSVALSMQFARLQLQRPSVRTDILAAARAPADLPRAEAERLVREAMDRVGLPAELERRGIDQLSGGQMRRVALAGLLASRPGVLVLDEPLAGLDSESRALLVDTLEQRRREGLAILVISHDTEGMAALCRRRLTLDAGVLS